MRSPCIEVCAFDGRTGWCRGCGRTRDECREWKKAPPNRQRRIAGDLGRRLAKLRERDVRD